VVVPLTFRLRTLLSQSIVYGSKVTPYYDRHWSLFHKMRTVFKVIYGLESGEGEKGRRKEGNLSSLSLIRFNDVYSRTCLKFFETSSHVSFSRLFHRAHNFRATDLNVAHRRSSQPPGLAVHKHELNIESARLG